MRARPVALLSPFISALLLTAALGVHAPSVAVAAEDWWNPFGGSDSKEQPAPAQSPPEDIPSGPIDEKARGVERTDLDPVMAPDGSGLPYELWRGLTLTAFGDAIAALEIPPRSPALNALWRRLITSDVTPPAGTEGGAQFTALRAEALDRSGLLVAASSALTKDPSVARDPVVAALLARTEIALDRRDRGCEFASAFRASEAQLPKPVQAEAIVITGYCAALKGDMAAAALQAGLAREVALPGFVGADILDAVANDAKPTVPNGAKLTPLDQRIAEIKGGFANTPPVAGASPSLLATLSSSASTPIEIRLAAGERAAALNIISPDDLAALYRLPGAGGEGGPIERASLFRSAESERTPVKKARLIRSFLDEARRAELYWPALRLMSKPVQSLQPVAEIGWFAETAVEVNLASGDFEQARSWANFGSKLDDAPGAEGPSEGRLLHWIALADIADPAVSTGRSAHLESVETLALHGRFDPTLLHRLATVLDALDIDVPIPLWDLASRTPQPAGGHLPDTGVLSELADASKKKEFGRTVLLAMRTLGPNGAEGAHMIALGDSIRALKRAGLEKEARQLALEGVFASWPRTASH